MLPLKLSNKAREDLVNIARYTEKTWGRDQRKFYLKHLDDAFQELARNPDLGRGCDEIRQGYFRYPQGSHVIFYRLGTESTLEVIRVLHKRMEKGLHF